MNPFSEKNSIPILELYSSLWTNVQLIELLILESYQLSWYSSLEQMK